jgi:hypothetical protein
MVLANGVETLASLGPSGRVVTLPLGVAVAVDQRRSPALADIIGARRVRTAVMISWGVDPLEIDAGRAEVRMPELPLDNVRRHALAGQLERVRVSQLMQRERRLTPAWAATRPNSVRTAAPHQGRPRVGRR